MAMDNELQKLRIDKSQKAARHERAMWPWIVCIFLLLALGAGYWQWHRATAAAIVKVVRVSVPEGAVVESDLVALNATGYITAAHKIELASKVIGRVAWVGVEMGDKIKKNQVLVRLEDDEYKARVAVQQGLLDAAKARLAEQENGSRPQEIAKAQADVEAAAADHANALTNLQRLQTINVGVSRQEVADANTLVLTTAAKLAGATQDLELMKLGPRKEQIDAAKADVRQLQGSVALAQVDLDNTIIRSTIDGTVLGRNVEVGEFVTTGFVGDNGAKGYVVSIADLNDLRVELDISQNDFAKIKPQQPCWIVTDAYPDRRYNGAVHLISPEANRQKATVQVRVKVLNPDGFLKPDMNATVSFLSPEKLAAMGAASTQPVGERPSIRVPSTAVRDGVVLTVENGKVVARTVKTGSTRDGEIEIKSGLIGGEEVIGDPPKALKEGDAVDVARE